MAGEGVHGVAIIIGIGVAKYCLNGAAIWRQRNLKQRRNGAIGGIKGGIK